METTHFKFVNLGDHFDVGIEVYSICHPNWMSSITGVGEIAFPNFRTKRHLIDDSQMEDMVEMGNLEGYAQECASFQLNNLHDMDGGSGGPHI